jgi:hypothetical protein
MVAVVSKRFIGPGFRIEAEAGLTGVFVGAVTGVAAVGQDGLDVKIVIDPLGQGLLDLGGDVGSGTASTR